MRTSCRRPRRGTAPSSARSVARSAGWAARRFASRRDSARPRAMGAPEKPPAARKRTRHRRTGLIVAAILLAGLLAFALSRLGLHRIGHALITARPGWVA